MSKSFKKLVAIVSAIAMVIAGITVQPQTANAAEALEWSELTDGLGKATIKNTSTEEVRGAEYKGFETDRSWGGDSKWQGQAKVNDVTVEAGQAYKVSLDVSSTPAKKILVQTLSGGEYVEKEYDTTVGHIEQTFAANNDKVNIVVAFGSFSDDEVGKYDVSISNFKLEKTEKSEEQIEKERVEALLTGDENIAKGKTAFSNSVKEKDYQPEEAFDGNLGSRYAAASYESGVTLGVDLGKTYKVSSVAFKWENAYATEYNIQVSKDGKAYDTVKTMTADKAETIEVPLDEAVEARYVRIECEYFRLEEIVAMCEKSGVHTQFVPDYHNIIPTKPYTEDLQGLPVINIRYVPLSNTFNAMLKRIVDIFGALVAIILFSPVMLFSCIMIKLTSPGPLIYRQTRVGLHNKPFEMYKFRSMEVQTEEKEKKAWTVKNDPRVTGFGKFMRHTSIDELPQLFNILKGDMSLVGPRPERPFFVEKFREEIPRYMVKHQVRPGLTGWAQVNGYRGDTSIRKRIDCDLYYIENWTLGLDFKILFLTFFKGFVNKNAY